MDRLNCGPLLQLQCPSCGSQTLRYFFLRPGGDEDEEDEDGGLGGFWMWCSTCRRFIHATSDVPAWWPDHPFVPQEVLAAEPDWLEANWHIVVRSRPHAALFSAD
jgi:hypothetical protein